MVTRTRHNQYLQAGKCACLPLAWALVFQGHMGHGPSAQSPASNSPPRLVLEEQPPHPVPFRQDSKR